MSAQHTFLLGHTRTQGCFHVFYSSRERGIHHVVKSRDKETSGFKFCKTFFQLLKNEKKVLEDVF